MKPKSFKHNPVCMTIELREVNESDKVDLFRWRNHPDLMKYAFHPTPVSWEEHERWFAAKLNDPKTTLYIAYWEGQKIGTIRYDERDRGIFVSVTLGPDFLGKGFGSKLISSGTQQFLREKSPDKPILAEIRSDNIASIKAFQKAGFEEIHRTYIFREKNVTGRDRLDDNLIKEREKT